MSLQTFSKIISKPSGVFSMEYQTWQKTETKEWQTHTTTVWSLGTIYMSGLNYEQNF